MKSVDLNVIAEVKATLISALAVAEPSVDGLYELAAAVGQAVRWVRAGAADLAAGVARGRAVLAGEDAIAVLGALDENALLGQLEGQLEDEDTHPATLFATLVDLDDHGAAAVLLGHPERAHALLAEAVILLQIHGDAASRAQALAAAHLASACVTPQDITHALWAAVAQATPDAPLVAQPISPRMAQWLASQALGKVLQFPVKRADAGPRSGWRAAAAGSEAITADSEPMAEDPAGRWQLVLERPQAHLELACYAHPSGGISFSVQVDGVDLPVLDDGDGRRAVALTGQEPTIEVEVAGERIVLHWPGA